MGKAVRRFAVFLFEGMLHDLSYFAGVVGGSGWIGCASGDGGVNAHRDRIDIASVGGYTSDATGYGWPYGHPNMGTAVVTSHSAD